MDQARNHVFYGSFLDYMQIPFVIALAIAANQLQHFIRSCNQPLPITQACKTKFKLGICFSRSQPYTRVLTRLSCFTFATQAEKT